MPGLPTDGTGGSGGDTVNPRADGGSWGWASRASARARSPSPSRLRQRGRVTVQLQTVVGEGERLDRQLVAEGVER